VLVCGATDWSAVGRVAAKDASTVRRGAAATACAHLRGRLRGRVSRLPTCSRA
jgi:hypothetical protein